MVEQEKKTPVSTPQTTALDPAPATSAAAAQTPTAATQPAGWLTREKKLAMAILGSFIALAAGVYAVKVVFKTKPPAEVVQAPSAEPPLEMPQQLTRPTNLEPSPVKLPPAIVTTGGHERIQELEPPIVLPPATMKEAPIVVPQEPIIKNGPAIDPLIIDVPVPMQRKDEFTNARKDNNGAAKNELPILDQPPILDDPPVVKNTVIRINGNEIKKEATPKIEAPKIPDPPPEIDPPLVVDPPMTKKEPAKKDPPDVDPPLVIDPPMTRKDSRDNDPPPVIDPPMTKKEPAKKDPPAMDPPLVIDPPMTRKDPPTIDIELKVPPRKVDAPANNNEYDEDLHPFKRDENYRTISKQYYNSDAYALALQRYNREHPGQAEYVRVPPIWVLEKKYASDIAATSARSTSNAPPLSVDPTRNEQIYTVNDNGEMLADVAKKTLGSEEAWKRIWDMNAQLNPAKMVPGGTRLRLPEGARGQP
jgi:hypothetical protein